MEQYTSEQALNGILNIITTVVNEYQQNKANQKSPNKQNETGNLVTELLGGIAAGSSKNVSLGSQVEELSKGMTALKQAGITDKDAKTVATMISTLGESIKNLEFSQANTDAVQSIAQSLVTLGSIDEDIIKRINNISSLDFKVADNLAKFLGKLSGIDADVGNVIKELRLMSKIKKEDINNITALNALNPKVADSLVKFIKKLDVEEKNIKGVSATLTTLTALGSIDKETIDNIEKLDDIDFNGVKKLVKFLENLDFSKMNITDQKKFASSLNQLKSVFGTINSIVNGETSTLSSLFAPLRARMLGRAIGNFLEGIAKGIPKNSKNTLKVELRGVTEIMDVFAKFAEKDSKYSISRLKKIMSYKNGYQIGMFFRGLLVNIPEYRTEGNKIVKAAPEVESVVNLIKLFTEFSVKDYVKIKMIMTERNGQKIGKFFSAIFDGLPSDRRAGAIKPVSDLLKELTSIGLTGVAVLSLLGAVLNEKFGKAINGFVNALLKDIDEEKSKQIETFTKSIKTLSTGMLILTGTILLLAGGIALLGIDIVVGSMIAVVAFTSAMLFVVKKLSVSDKDIEAGSKSLINVAKAITLLTADVLLLTIAANLMDFVDWIALAKMATMFVMLSVVTGVIMKITDTWQGKGEEAMKAMLGISAILVAGATAVAISVYVAKNNKMNDIIAGLAMVAAVMFGSLKLLVEIGKKANKDLENGIRSMWNVVAMLTVTALVINFLLIPIAKKFGDAVLGIIAVSAVMAFMFSMVKWLSTMDTKKLKAAQNTLVIMTAMLVVVSLVADFILPEVGKQIDDVALGGVAVMTIIGLMTAMVIILTKFVKKKDLTEANITLAVLTTMLVAVSLVAAFIMPEIGKNIDDVALGGVAVMVIIALMVTMVIVLTHMVKKKDLAEANITLAVLTVMLVAVSLVGAFLLPAIGANIKEAALGGVVVMLIVALMVTMVIVLTRMVRKKDLLQANITFAVLTVMLVAVALIAAFILPEVGANIKDAALGGVVVMLIIALMVTMVIVLTRMVRKKDLLQANITLAVLTFMLLGVSLIAAYLLPKIGEDWKDAAAGGVVVLAIIGIMIGMVFLLTKVPKTKLTESLILLAAMAFMLLGVSLITKDILIPIGDEWDAAAVGGAVVLSIIALMTTIIYAAGKMDLKQIGKGSLAVAAAGALIAGVGWVVNKFMVPLGKNAKEAALGSSVAIGTLTAMTVIVALTGKLDIKTIVAGTATVAALELLIWGLAKAFKPYIEVCIQMYKNAAEVAKGGLIILATLTAWGLIITGVGALVLIPGVAEILAAGGATVAGLAAVLLAIGKCLPSYINVCKSAYENRNYVKNGSKVVVDIIKKMGLIVAAVGTVTMIPGVALIMGAGSAVLATFMGVIRTIAKGLDPFISLMKKMSDNNITSQTIAKFSKVFLGNGPSDKNGLIGSIRGIADGMSKISVFASLKAGFISEHMLPMFKTLSMFIDVVGKISSMKYVVSWNKDGTPAEYGTLSMEQFKKAGDTISTTFATFLIELSKGLTALEKVSLEAIYKLSIGIKPVTEAVAKFTDTIMTVLNSKIECAWDKDGNPTKYRKFNAAEFQQAAIVVSNNFSRFLTILSKQLAPISAIAGQVMNQLKDGINPVIDSVAKLTDTILTFIKGTDITIEQNGKQITRHINFSPAQFQKAGQTIGKGFVDFIMTLYNSFKVFDREENVAVAYQTQEGNSYLGGLVDTRKNVTKFKTERRRTNLIGKLLANLQDLGTVVDATSSYVDVIVKVAQNLQKYNLPEAGKKIAGMLVNFVTTMTNNFSAKGYDQKLKQTMSNLDQVKKLVNKFSDAYKPLADIFKDNKKLVTRKDIDDLYDRLIYLVQDKKIATINKLKVENISGALPYVKKMVEIAKELGNLTKAMQNSKMTKACQQFIKDIEILTQQGLTKKVSASRRALGVFGGDLKIFTKVVVNTEKRVIKFTGSMNKATNSLRKLDDALLKRERQREAALQRMTNLINNVAKSVKNLTKEIESLDQNKILENFKGISELLELAQKDGKAVVNGEPTTTPPTSRMTNNNNGMTLMDRMGWSRYQNHMSNNGRPVAQTVHNHNNYNSGPKYNMDGTSIVEFKFSNIAFNGFMTVKQV